MTFSNCSTNETQENFNSQTQFFPDTTKKENDNTLHLTTANILGDWTNCSTTSKGVTITANVCRTVLFKSDKTAIIKYPSKDFEVINWKVYNDSLFITWTEDTKHRLFTDSIYETSLTKDTQGYNLELKTSSVTYYLGRPFN